MEKSLFLGKSLGFAVALCFIATCASANTADAEDLARAVLKCFHPTGGFMSYSERGKWSDARSYGASDSQVIDINFRGAWTGNGYRLKTAILVREKNGSMQMRAEVLSDDAIMPPNPNCSLRDWR